MSSPILKKHHETVRIFSIILNSFYIWKDITAFKFYLQLSDKTAKIPALRRRGLLITAFISVPPAKSKIADKVFQIVTPLQVDHQQCTACKIATHANLG